MVCCVELPHRPQANRGISSYRPVDRFVRGQLHLERMSSHECQHALGELAAHSDLLDAGHNEEPAAISVAHRGAGAGARSSYPSIVDPQSTPEWRTLRNRVVRQLSDPAYEPELQYPLPPHGLSTARPSEDLAGGELGCPHQPSYTVDAALHRVRVPINR